jgi:hypothetical protein
MKFIAETSRASHPGIKLILFKELVQSVLKYGCVCFAEMAATHLKKLERVQWHGLRISLC